MEKIAKFSKVSFEQFETDFRKNVSPEIANDLLKTIYEEIKPPERATAGSAGYDFKLPYSFAIGTSYITIPTGIRCEIKEGWQLKLYPRSGHGFKYRARLANTVGVIDSDYFYADNEGHIMCKMSAEIGFMVNEGTAFVQGVFEPYGITVDDAADGVRVGGFGSTGA